jgi:hypothetical protein
MRARCIAKRDVREEHHCRWIDKREQFSVLHHQFTFGHAPRGHHNDEPSSDARDIPGRPDKLEGCPSLDLFRSMRALRRSASAPTIADWVSFGRIVARISPFGPAFLQAQKPTEADHPPARAPCSSGLAGYSPLAETNVSRSPRRTGAVFTVTRGRTSCSEVSPSSEFLSVQAEKAARRAARIIKRQRAFSVGSRSVHWQ